MKNLIHKTFRSKYENIIEEGFKIPQDQPGRFGYGVYFMTEDNFGHFGDGVSIICDVSNEFILDMTHDEVRELYPYLDYQEGGEPELEKYVIEKGYKAVSISYLDGSTEVVVYDTSIIKIQNVIIKA